MSNTPWFEALVPFGNFLPLGVLWRAAAIRFEQHVVYRTARDGKFDGVQHYGFEFSAVRCTQLNGMLWFSCPQ